MKAKSDLPERLKATGSGLGEASQTDVDRRAAELAQIDGRDVIHRSGSRKGIRGARRSFRHRGEADTRDEAAEDFGKRTHRTPMENDTSLGEQLTRQGMADAEHDRRVAASDDANT
jgi:hypothetical protein